jgi:hypothetical protein
MKTHQRRVVSYCDWVENLRDDSDFDRHIEKLASYLVVKPERKV